MGEEEQQTRMHACSKTDGRKNTEANPPGEIQEKEVDRLKHLGVGTMKEITNPVENQNGEEKEGDIMSGNTVEQVFEEVSHNT